MTYTQHKSTAMCTHWFHSPLYPNEANKPGFRQLYIFDAADSKTKQVENQSNQDFRPRNATIGLNAVTSQLNC
jgi:hypothetical protein